MFGKKWAAWGHPGGHPARKEMAHTSLHCFCTVEFEELRPFPFSPPECEGIKLFYRIYKAGCMCHPEVDHTPLSPRRPAFLIMYMKYIFYWNEEY